MFGTEAGLSFIKGAAQLFEMENVNFLDGSWTVV